MFSKTQNVPENLRFLLRDFFLFDPVWWKSEMNSKTYMYMTAEPQTVAALDTKAVEIPFCWWLFFDD